jgi:hypothetical protein
MSDQNHYLMLGVDENASFEEIQDARNRLVQEHSGDRKLVESIEAAYDAILMDRLRLRQEGKIKVPDRIRFPERLVEAPPEFTPISAKQTPDWLQRFIDTPSRADILWPAALFVGTGFLSLSSPSVGLALGVGFSLYFLNRKEHKFGRAFLITLVSLILGVILGLQAASLLQPQLVEMGIATETFAAWFAFFVLWLTDSFLR